MNLVGKAILLFSALLLMPLAMGMFWYFFNKESVLPVKSDRKRDPRFFARSFRRRFAKAWENRKGNTLTMSSRPEKYINSDTMGERDWPTVCRAMVVAEHNRFAPPPRLTFEKEIAANQNASIPVGTTLRAISAQKNLTFYEQSTVVRWADAVGTVNVGDHCDLGMSLTSATRIRIGRDCLFRRLYAPMICLGMDRGEFPAREVLPNIQKLQFPENRDYKRHVGKGQNDSDTGNANSTYLSAGKITVDENMVVQGSIRAQHGVQIGDNAVVCGNVFADGEVHLGENSTVLGNIFSQENIYLGRGSIVGRPGQTRSIVSRGQIYAAEGCVVYGYMSNETGGFVCVQGKRESVQQETEEWKTPKRRGSRGLGILAGATAVTAISGILVGASLMNWDLQDIRDVKETKEVHYVVDEHRNQGLDAGETLSGIPYAITPQYIELSDRMLVRCAWTQEQLQNQADAAAELLAEIRSRYPHINVYSTFIPCRVGFEEKFAKTEKFRQAVASEREILQDAEDRISWELSHYSTFVPLMETLTEHQEEYLFYRSTDSWAMGGSYHGAQEFLKAAGMETFPITDYYALTRNRFHGSLQNRQESVVETPIMYLYKDYNPLVTELRTGERPPMFTAQRGGTGCFLGDDSHVALLPGLAKNGRCLLLIGGNPAKLLPPWLINQFENIITVNMSRFSLRKGDQFWAHIDNYQVTDVLLALNAEELISTGFTSRLSNLSRIY